MFLLLLLSLFTMQVSGLDDNGWGPWGSWGPCSKTCGRGLKSRNSTCTGIVNSSRSRLHCSRQTGRLKVGYELCNLQPCPFRVLRTGDVTGRDDLNAEEGWGPWGEWSSCSRSCGGGVSHRNSTCNTNATKRDLASGSHCSRESVRFKVSYKMCNTQACPSSTEDYRSYQCSQYNKVAYKGKFYTWKSFEHSAGECELKCTPEKEFFYVTLKRQVADGTKCNEFSRDVCVKGKCVPVGCDMKLWSEARVDKCGVCDGDGSSCRVIRRTFKLVSDAYGYVDVVSVPKGATGIKVTENDKTTNFLAITSNGANVLNADYAISSSFGTKRYKGHVIRYERTNKLNQIKISGPLTVPLQFQVYVARYSERPILYQYEYFVPKGVRIEEVVVSEYDWVVGQWSNCSKICARGTRTRLVYCARKNTRTKVGMFNCGEKQPITQEDCATEACPSRWYISGWSPCSKSCGKGFHTRRVHCVTTGEDGNMKMLEDKECQGTTPAKMGTCYMQKFCPKWETSEWSKCSRSCGNGVQTRIVNCVRGKGIKTKSHMCEQRQKPDTTQLCHNFPCGARWSVEKWSNCSSVCGRGVRHRQVICKDVAGTSVPRNHCAGEKEPSHFQRCTAKGGCKPMWQSSEWSECSAKCGYGMQIRTVSCAQPVDGKFVARDKTACDVKTKPKAMRDCPEVKPCQVNYFVSKWGQCSVTCGVGFEMRDVRCYADQNVDYSGKHCENLIKPSAVQMCSKPPCQEGNEVNIPAPLFDDVIVPLAASEPPLTTTTTTTTMASITTTELTTTNIPTTPRTIESQLYQPATIVSFEGPAKLSLNQYSAYKCVATGYPIPVADWSYAGSPLSSSLLRGTYRVTKRIAKGKIDTVLAIKPSSLISNEEVRCNVANSVGFHTLAINITVTGELASPTTIPTTQSINSPPNIVSLTGPEDLEAGENADYQCVVSGNPPPSITWKLNSKPLDETRFRVLNNGRRSRLILITSDYADTGDLKCLAENTYGKHSSKLSLKISGVPHVSITPKIPTYKEGTAVTLTCNAKGLPAPTIVWEKDGKRFLGDYKRVLVVQNRIMFKGMVQRDMGRYTCRGYNSQGMGIDSLVVYIERDRRTRVDGCIDNNTKADCRLIASLTRLCSIPHYNTVCCETCRGKL